MFSIEIHEEAETSEDMANALRRIADLLDEGYTSGVSPNWMLKGDKSPDKQSSTLCPFCGQVCTTYPYCFECGVDLIFVNFLHESKQQPKE